MSSALAKTGVVFGIILFYIVSAFLLGWIGEERSEDTGLVTESTSQTGWTFNKLTTNISELGWFNTIFLIPLGIFIILLFLTSNPLIHME